MPGPDQDRKETIEKYKQLYSMAEAAFKDEDDRYNRIMDNALKYFPIIVFLFGVGAFFAKWTLDKLIPPKDWVELSAIICVALAFLCLVFAAVLLILSRRYGKVRLFRPDERDIAFCDAHDIVTVYGAYADRFNQERVLNAEITDK